MVWEFRIPSKWERDVIRCIGALRQCVHHLCQVRKTNLNFDLMMTLDVKNQGIIRDSMFHPEQDMNANKNVIGPVVVNIFQLCFNSLKPRHVASSRHFDLFLCCPRFLGEVNKIRTLGIFLLLDVKYATQLLLGVSLLAVFFWLASAPKVCFHPKGAVVVLPTWKWGVAALICFKKSQN